MPFSNRTRSATGIPVSSYGAFLAEPSSVGTRRIFSGSASAPVMASPIFAIAAVLSIIVMYDAMGVRYETGEQAKVLNRMFTEWMDQGFEQFQLPHGKKLKEMVGHTPIEVLTGAALGIVLGFAMPMV